MTFQNDLNLVSETKPVGRSPVMHRRELLHAALMKQMHTLDAYQRGEKAKRSWFWQGDDGKYYVEIRYGKKPLELSKGKFSIQCADIDEVRINLTKIQSLLMTGELDRLLEKASKEIRKKFKKNVIARLGEV